MEAVLLRSRFSMRPSLSADRADIAQHIFGDVEVAKTLVHNVSSQEGALEATDAWIEALAIDGSRNSGNPEHIGLWTIRDAAGDNEFVGIRGVFVAPGLPENTVATFVAVDLLCTKWKPRTTGRPYMGSQNLARQITSGFYLTPEPTLRQRMKWVKPRLT